MNGYGREEGAVDYRNPVELYESFKEVFEADGFETLDENGEVQGFVATVSRLIPETVQPHAWYDHIVNQLVALRNGRGVAIDEILRELNTEVRSINQLYGVRASTRSKKPKSSKPKPKPKPKRKPKSKPKKKPTSKRS